MGGVQVAQILPDQAVVVAVGQEKTVPVTQLMELTTLAVVVAELEMGREEQEAPALLS